MYSRDTVWTANLDPNNVKKIKIKDLTDKHLANIIKHTLANHYKPELVDFLKHELEFRGLPESFLDNAPYPYEPDEYDKINGIQASREKYIKNRIKQAGE